MPKASSIPARHSHLGAELAYVRKNGASGDELIHKEILSNPEADRAFRDSAIRRAVEGGMTLQDAHSLFG